jgi:hypothetical protein
MFPAYSVSLICAVCAARFLDGSRTLFENLGTTVQANAIFARPFAKNPHHVPQFLIDIWRLEIGVSH